MNIQNGLKPIYRKKTDRSFHRTFGGVTPTEFPDEFSVDAGLTMPDQVADGLFQGCTAYTQQELCTDQDHKLYDDYKEHYMRTLALTGSPFGVGCDIRDSLKVAIAYYNRGAYYAVESSKFDWFDSIRSVMLTNFQVNGIKCSVSVGTPWFKIFDIQVVGKDGKVPVVNKFDTDPMSISWHNWAVKGWKMIDGKPWMLVKSWQGKNVGDGGWYYVSRETINAVLSIKWTGAYTVAPRNPVNIVTVKWTITDMLINLMTRLVDALKDKSTTNIVTVPVEEPLDVPVPVDPEKYNWSGITESKHSVRVICDEQGLSLEGKNLICAVIQAESNFNINATNKNKNKAGVTVSTDWGICQINDYYHVGSGKAFSSVQEILDNPEKSVIFMIKMYRAGKLGLWVAYLNGSYKKYL